MGGFSSTFQAYSSFGTQIRVGDGLSPQTFHLISGVGTITGPKTALASKESTAHSSLSPHRTFVPTLIDDGSLSFPVFWNESDPTHSGNSDGGVVSTYSLYYLFENRVIRAFKISNADPSSTTRQFQGFVSQLGETYAVDGLQVRDIAIMITSAPSYTSY